MILRLVFCCSSLMLGLTTPSVGRADSASAAPDQPSAPVVEALDVAPVWAAHPVNFALLTHKPFQFVAYYDAQRQLTVAQRKLDETTWSFTRLPTTTGWDSHNYITMVVDDDGFLHLSGDMHASPLNYYRSSVPLDASTFEKIDGMTGDKERRTTYPKFMRGPQPRIDFLLP